MSLLIVGNEDKEEEDAVALIEDKTCWTKER